MSYWNRLGIKYAAVCLLVLLLNGCEKAEQSVPVLSESAGTQLETAVVTRGDLFEMTTFDGKVYPELKELTFGTEGTVAEVKVALGDTVKKGDTLFLLKNEGLEQELASLKEQLKESEVNNSYEYDIQKLELEIQKLTLKQKQEEKAPAIEIAQIQANYDRQKLLLEQYLKVKDFDKKQLQVKIQELEKSMNSFRITAPADGKVVYLKETHLDTPVKEGDTAIYLADYSGLYIQGEYLEEAVVEKAELVYALIKGREYPLEYDPYTVEELLRMKNSSTGMGSRFRFKESGDYASGDYGCICLKNKVESNVLSIPKTALNSDGEEAFVYLVIDGALVKRTVKTGMETSIQVEIKDGLKEGEVVYVKG
ncbi:efflux RND transporter periplasmic adaptor subunit [Clostridium sp. KNHs205]|uniref:efflux RND transporter periplasmic adaptor subunit n=1 Tax=Clostridium sp. KNHs205 TaxID=1449050 RepID=UPI0012DF3579|nr:efflux RND transporter periplasmic adaptor subunit [Clostridium sp. KNHs205]